MVVLVWVCGFVSKGRRDSGPCRPCCSERRCLTIQPNPTPHSVQMQVIAILKDPKAKQADLVGAEFEKVGKAVWAEVSKKAEAAGSKEGVAALSAELKALKAKKELSETDADAAVRVYYNAMKAGVKPAQLK